MVLEAFARVLSYEGDMVVVGEATNGPEAIDLAEKLRPDVVVMDLLMPGMDGDEAVGQIKARLPQTKILMVSAYKSEADINRVLESGCAMGYVLKDRPTEELLIGIREVAGGRSYLSPEIAARLIGRISNTDTSLSSQELKVLRRVRFGKSNDEITRDLHISKSGVKNTLQRIFEKLGVPDRTAAVTTALERGILRLEDSWDEDATGPRSA